MPDTAITVWPAAGFPGMAGNGGAFLTVEGSPPFLIVWPRHPFLEAIFFEIAHVGDDGWMTPAQRDAFAQTAGADPATWLDNGNDDNGATLADNFAGAYAVAAVYGAHPPARVVRSWAGMPPSIWSAEYAIVLAVAQASEASPPTFPVGSPY